MKRILITGASGFIGSHLVDGALRKGMETYAAIRKTSKREYLQDAKIHVAEIDFNAPESLRKLLKSTPFDYIIHTAGTTHAPNPETYNRVNSGTLQILVELIQEEQIPLQKFVYLSSLAAFGPNENHTGRLISNDSRPMPVTAYGRSKLLAEEYLQKQAIPWVIIRPTAVYGPRDRSFLPIYRSIGSGFEIYFTRKKQKLSFVYIHDLVDAIYRSLDGPAQTAYFVSDGCEYSLQEFFQVIKTIRNKKTIPVYLPTGMIRQIATLNELFCKPFGVYPFFNSEKVNELVASGWMCDLNHLITSTGFQPGYTLKKGMAETLEFYKKKGF